MAGLRIMVSMNAHDLKDVPGSKHVSRNPAVLGGTLVFAGTRVPVSTLYDYLADGLSVDYFLESFPSVEREQVLGVLRLGEGLHARELST